MPKDAFTLADVRDPTLTIVFMACHTANLADDLHEKWDTLRWVRAGPIYLLAPF
jgi:hypothetical protein